jgi:hypothetical protein
VLHQGLVFDRGNVAISCGLFQQLSSCVNSFYKPNIKKWTQMHNYLTAFHTDWAAMFEQPRVTGRLASQLLQVIGATNTAAPPSTLSIPHVQQVVLLDSSWDFNYHHLLVESAPRLVRLLSFLLRHSEEGGQGQGRGQGVWIHLREEELLDSPVPARRHREGACLRRGVLQLLGLSPARIISGPVLADSVLVPQDQGCSNFLEHPFELRRLAGLLLRASKRVLCEGAVVAMSKSKGETGTSRIPFMKNIVVHNRPCNKNTTAYIWRCFSDSSLHLLAAATREVFPEHRVFVHPRSQPAAAAEGGRAGVAGTYSSSSSGSSSSGSNCRDQMACGIQQARSTDIFIGLHGAAMTNVMFMRPGSLLVEVVGYFDGKMLPVCGIYGPLAAVFGVHHYIYYYDGLYEDGEEGSSGQRNLGLNSSTEGLLDMDDMMKSVREYYDTLLTYSYRQT